MPALRTLLISLLVFLALLTFAPTAVLHPPRLFANDNDREGPSVAAGEDISTNPKYRNVSVKATVLDHAAPSAPILVSPENGAALADNMLEFVWKDSTDDISLKKYQLFLDGVVYIDDLIPPGVGATKTTARYFYRDSSGVSTLTLRTPLPDGAHTWKVRVFDTSDNTADSATWSFTIDTTAPVLVINHIGEVSVSISAQDIATIPTEPIVLRANEPVVSGVTEANATVKISVRIADRPWGALETTAAVDGTFAFTLPVLPRDTLITLQVTAQDAAGNLSVIDGIRLKIVLMTVTPFVGLPAIPVVPPEEVRRGLLEQLRRALPDEVVFAIDAVAPLANSLLGLGIPLARELVALHLLGVAPALVSPLVLLDSLRAIGFSPLFLPPLSLLGVFRKRRRKIQGLIFDADTDVGVPFALVSVYRVETAQSDSAATNSRKTLMHTEVANSKGIYQGIELPAGSYLVEITQRDYRPLLMNERVTAWGNAAVFSGQMLEVGSETAGADRWLCQLVPMVSKNAVCRPAADHHCGSLRTRLEYWFAPLPGALIATATLLMLVPLFFAPTLWNALMFAIYGWVSARRLLRKMRLPTVVGAVLSGQGAPLAHAIVRVIVRVVETRSTSGAEKVELLYATALLSAANGEFALTDARVKRLALEGAEEVGAQSIGATLDLQSIWLDGTASQPVDIKADQLNRLGGGKAVAVALVHG